MQFFPSPIYHLSPVKEPFLPNRGRGGPKDNEEPKEIQLESILFQNGEFIVEETGR